VAFFSQLAPFFTSGATLRFQNAIWHGFVLPGAACHYAAILKLILAFSR
jgi:hemolysin III